MASKQLRAVKAGEKPAQNKPKSLAEAVEGEDYLEILLAQRREMIRDVREVNGPAKAALHRQIALHSKEIAALQAAAKQAAAEESEADDESLDASAV
jgi:hypothetical protein